MKCRRSGLSLLATFLLVVAATPTRAGKCTHARLRTPTCPRPGRPEAISVSALPLPPTAPSSAPGSCTNPTGCIDATRAGIDGVRTFSPDGNHVYVSIKFAGAPVSSVYTGGQLILVKTDGSTFPNGDAWKCITCGVPAANKVDINDPSDNTYPEAFNDGMRVKMGNNILDCEPYEITDAACTPEHTHIYPIKSPFPPTAGVMRELRLHPDNVHLGWNQLFFSNDFTAASEFGVFGRLVFDPAPASGAPGYELHDVSFMFSPELGKSGRFFSVRRPGTLRFERPMGVIGEFRGFTSDGKRALGIGTQDSFNYDIFATSLRTGRSRRLTRDPAYTDPVSISPDGKWAVVMDGRLTADTGYPGANPMGSDGRMYFASAGIGVPPLIDLAIAEAVGSLYTNRARGSFFEPYLIDLRASRCKHASNVHDGVQLNAGGDPTAGSGSISDPLWTGGADPAWSPDGTAVVYYQRRGCNAGTTCPPSTEPGGRQSRLMIATLTDRKPVRMRRNGQIKPVPDVISWGTPYVPGDTLPPVRATVPAGIYVLTGKRGSANVVITEGPSRFNPRAVEVVGVKVTYHDYSADGVNFVAGTEEGSRTTTPPSSTSLTWHADLTFSGLHTGTRKTSELGGFVVTTRSLGGTATFSGSLTTTIDGLTFRSPAN